MDSGPNRSLVTPIRRVDGGERCTPAPPRDRTHVTDGALSEGAAVTRGEDRVYDGSAFRRSIGSCDIPARWPRALVVIRCGNTGGVELSLPPDPEAYGRVTNPERYSVVVDRARRLIDRLVERFDVSREDGNVSVAFPRWRGVEGEPVLLQPAQGAPIAFMITEFPGVVVRFGHWGEEGFPSCGCDACGEDPAEVIDRLERLVDANVRGQYSERLTRRWLWVSFSGEDGSEWSRGRVFRSQRRYLGGRGRHEWLPWRAR